MSMFYSTGNKVFQECKQAVSWEPEVFLGCSDPTLTGVIMCPLSGLGTHWGPPGGAEEREVWGFPPRPVASTTRQQIRDRKGMAQRIILVTLFICTEKYVSFCTCAHLMCNPVLHQL